MIAQLKDAGKTTNELCYLVVGLPMVSFGFGGLIRHGFSLCSQRQRRSSEACF